MNSLKNSDVQPIQSSGIEENDTSVNSSLSDDDFENRLYVINKSGTGEAMYLLLNKDKTDFESYRIKIEHWECMKDLVDFGVAVVENCVYILGGYDKSSAKKTSTVHKYNASELKWTICSPMSIARSKFAVGIVDSNIVVLGGEKNGGNVTASCEAYDPQTDKWSKRGLLIEPRVNHCCVVDGKDIYCAGGFSNNSNHDNLWVFEHHKWSELDPDYPQRLAVSLDRFNLVNVNGTFYFIGGVEGNVSSKTLKTKFRTHGDIFSYTASISSNTELTEASDVLSPWNYRLPSLLYPRHSAGTVVIGNRIYVIGGSILETGHQIRRVEYFDLKRRRWEEDFQFRKGNVSNVVCSVLKVPKSPGIAKKRSMKDYKWILW